MSTYRVDLEGRGNGKWEEIEEGEIIIGIYCVKKYLYLSPIKEENERSIIVNHTHLFLLVTGFITLNIKMQSQNNMCFDFSPT